MGEILLLVVLFVIGGLLQAAGKRRREVPSTSRPLPEPEPSSSGGMMAFWTISLVIIVVMELNALGMLPWKTEANKGLNQMYDGPGVRNPLIAGFGLWVVFLILSEIFLKAA